MTYPAFLSRLPRHLRIQETDSVRILPLQSQETVQTVVQLAHDMNVKLGILGENTIHGSDRLLLDFSALNQIQHYRPEEFLITVETGLTINALEATLFAKSQTLGLQYPPQRSLLSLLGAPPLCLSAWRYPSLSRLVVGLKAITGDGQPIHYGGEVVKNVTGYDMIKLFVGSQHRYGLITQVTLKLFPFPTRQRRFLVHLQSDTDRTRFCQTAPEHCSTLEGLLAMKTKTTFGWHLMGCFSGEPAAVDRDMMQLHDLLKTCHSAWQEFEVSDDQWAQWLDRLDWSTHLTLKDLLVEVGLPQPQLDAFLQDPTAIEANLLYECGRNRCYVHWSPLQRPSPDQLETWRKKILQQGGQLRLLQGESRFDEALAHGMAQSGEGRVLLTWQNRLKSQFDPLTILSPDPLATFHAQEGASPR